MFFSTDKELLEGIQQQYRLMNRLIILKVVHESVEPIGPYEILAAIGLKTQKFWEPSIGSIYPALNRFEEAGLIQKVGKQYQITQKGVEMLEKNLALSLFFSLHVDSILYRGFRPNPELFMSGTNKEFEDLLNNKFSILPSEKGKQSLFLEEGIAKIGESTSLLKELEKSLYYAKERIMGRNPRQVLEPRYLKCLNPYVMFIHYPYLDDPLANGQTMLHYLTNKLIFLASLVEAIALRGYNPIVLVVISPVVLELLSHKKFTDPLLATLEGLRELPETLERGKERILGEGGITLLKRYVSEGMVEIVGSLATHPPSIVYGNDFSLEIQVDVAVATYRHYLDVTPKGFWVGEDLSPDGVLGSRILPHLATYDVRYLVLSSAEQPSIRHLRPNLGLLLTDFSFQSEVEFSGGVDLSNLPKNSDGKKFKLPQHSSVELDLVGELSRPIMLQTFQDFSTILSVIWEEDVGNNEVDNDLFVEFLARFVTELKLYPPKGENGDDQNETSSKTTVEADLGWMWSYINSCAEDLQKIMVDYPSQKGSKNDQEETLIHLLFVELLLMQDISWSICRGIYTTQEVANQQFHLHHQNFGRLLWAVKELSDKQRLPRDYLENRAPTDLWSYLNFLKKR